MPTSKAPKPSARKRLVRAETPPAPAPELWCVLTEDGRPVHYTLSERKADAIDAITDTRKEWRAMRDLGMRAVKVTVTPVGEEPNANG